VHYIGSIFLFGGKPPKAGNLYCDCGLSTNNQQPSAEELNYSHKRAQRHQHPTNNMLEVWQNLAPFFGRPICSTVEVLLTKVINQQLSVLPIVVFFVAAAVSVIIPLNGTESIYSQSSSLRV
jgi:hypothetical protein